MSKKKDFRCFFCARVLSKDSSNKTCPWVLILTPAGKKARACVSHPGALKEKQRTHLNRKNLRAKKVDA